MQHMDSISSFFRRPKWGMQLLLCCICLLIPIVGVIALFGYFIEIFVAQLRGTGDELPEFDFDRFGRYIGTGIWPFLAQLVTGLCAIPFAAIVVAPLITIPVLELEDELMAIPIIATVLLYILLVLLLTVIAPPLRIRSALTQNFADTFSRTWVVDFIKRMWGQIILMYLFLFAISIPMIMAGYLTCGLGLYPAMLVLMYSSWHLQRQLYQLYLKRGGTAIEIASKLLPKELAPSVPQS